MAVIRSISAQTSNRYYEFDVEVNIDIMDGIMVLYIYIYIMDGH